MYKKVLIKKHDGQQNREKLRAYKQVKNWNRNWDVINQKLPKLSRNIGKRGIGKT